MNRKKLSLLLDRISGFLAPRKGLLPILGLLLILVNFFFQLYPLGWLSSTSLFLHLGLILAILGFLLAWAL